MRLIGEPATLCIMADCPVCKKRNIVVIGDRIENGRLITTAEFENKDSTVCAHLLSVHSGYSKLLRRDVYALEFKEGGEG